MKQKFFRWLIVMALMALAGVQTSAQETTNRKPTLFLIGDSTVNNTGKGQLGWGKPLAALFDEKRIRVENRARGGRSSRTFYTEELWSKVADELKPGDFVLMQFGHNDGGPLDNPRNRASVKGIGDETRSVTNQSTGKVESVHSYGWYLRQFVADTKARGALPIVASPIPRNIWTNGIVRRASNDYARWAAEVARAEQVPFLDLNEIIAGKYETIGQQKVAAEFFNQGDHTHTTPAGAELNARCVAEGIRGLTDPSLAGFLLPNSMDDNAAARSGPAGEL
jgi:lysophospholipase L1-like esterase